MEKKISIDGLAAPSGISPRTAPRPHIPPKIEDSGSIDGIAPKISTPPSPFQVIVQKRRGSIDGLAADTGSITPLQVVKIIPRASATNCAKKPRNPEPTKSIPTPPAPKVAITPPEDTPKETSEDNEPDLLDTIEMLDLSLDDPSRPPSEIGRLLAGVKDITLNAKRLICERLMSVLLAIKSRLAKLDKMAALRYTASTAVLVVAGFLAVDTWLTNRSVDDTAMIAVGEIIDEPLASSGIMWRDAGAGTEGEGASPDSTSAANTAAARSTQNVIGRISIPKIGTNSRVVSVGLDATNHIMTPMNLKDVGWYSGSGAPGAPGAVFLDGHAGVNAPGVFADLSKLSAGDPIIITDNTGVTWTYLVKEVKNVPLDNVNMAEALSVYPGYSHGLNIVTCSGNYDRNTRTYDHRTILFAALEH